MGVNGGAPGSVGQCAQAGSGAVGGGIPSHLSVDQGDADPVVPIESPALAAQGVELLQWGKGMACQRNFASPCWGHRASLAPLPFIAPAHSLLLTSPLEGGSARTPAPLVPSFTPADYQQGLTLALEEILLPGCLHLSPRSLPSSLHSRVYLLTK